MSFGLLFDHGLKRNRDHVIYSFCRDLGGRAHSRPKAILHIVGKVNELDNDPKFFASWTLMFVEDRRSFAICRPRAASFANLADDFFIAKSIDFDLRLLADLDLVDLSLIDLDLDVDRTTYRRWSKSGSRKPATANVPTFDGISAITPLIGATTSVLSRWLFCPRRTADC